MEVIITPKATKQYRNLTQPDQIKIKKRILLLKSQPLEGKKLSGTLAEMRSLRAWPYRILYYIDLKKQKLFIVTIAHRQGVYK